DTRGPSAYLDYTIPLKLQAIAPPGDHLYVVWHDPEYGSSTTHDIGTNYSGRLRNSKYGVTIDDSKTEDNIADHVVSTSDAYHTWTITATLTDSGSTVLSTITTEVTFADFVYVTTNVVGNSGNYSTYQGKVLIIAPSHSYDGSGSGAGTP